jgi:hypothetical protein
MHNDAFVRHNTKETAYFKPSSVERDAAGAGAVDSGATCNSFPAFGLSVLDNRDVMAIANPSHYPVYAQQLT